MIFSIKPQIFELKCVFSYFRLKTHITLLLPVYVHSWEQRKLGELVDVCSGRDYKHLSEGTIPVYGTGGYMLSVNEALSYDKDAIGIGRKGTIDKPYILKAPFWTVDTLFYAIPREKVDLNFAFDIFQNIDWKKKDESTGVPSLSKTAINNIYVLAPKFEEQQVLGRFFSRIDNLITLHQRKHDKLTNVKKSMLEKMFPQNGSNVPEIRFKGFTEAWEQRKLGEVAKYRNGKAHENCIDESGKYIVVNSKFVSTNGTVIKHSNMQNEPLAQNEIAFVLSDVPNGRAIARTFLVEENDKYTLNQRIAGITSSENTYPYFLHILMNRHPYFLAFDDGVKQTNLSVSDVLNFETYYPEYEEQKQIGEYFRNLDRLITLHQRELEKLKKLKKACLEKMFV